MDQPTTFFAWVTLVVGVAILLRNTNGRRGSFVAPFNIAVLIIVSIYGIRPLFNAADNSHLLYGRSSQEGFVEATLVGLVALASLTLGYLVTRKRRQVIYPDEVDHPAPDVRYSMYRAAMFSFGLTGVWVLLVSSRGGGFEFINIVFEGRQDSTDAALQGMPQIVGALPTAGAVLVAAVAVVTQRERRLYFGERWAFRLGILVSIIPPMALGSRRYLLPCLIVWAIAVTAPRYTRRIKVWHVAVGLVGFVFLAITPFVRSAGSRATGGNLVTATIEYVRSVGVVESVRPFFTSYDTEMFNYVALLATRLNEASDFGWGRGTLRDSLLNPFPASMMPMPTWSDQLLIEIYGGTCGRGSVCPVPSFAGVLYYDLWFPGVILGSFFLGYLARRYPTWLATTVRWRLVLCVGLAGFTPVLIRGNIVNVGYIAGLAIGVAAFLFACCAGRMPSPAENHRFERVGLRDSSSPPLMARLGRRF